MLSLEDIPATAIAKPILPIFPTPRVSSQPKVSADAISKLGNASARPTFSLEGYNDLLEVYQDKVTITPKGFAGLITRGFKGTKTIPFFSITATQYKPAGFLTKGYLQFTIPGGNESRGGLRDAFYDENTFVFNGEDNNYLVEKIKNFIEKAVQEARAPKVVTAAGSPSLSDEISKLSKLMADGLLTEEEFKAAKGRLLSR